MERLTSKNWRNLDPWEMCGQDNYCKRGCHDQGGCTKGCIVPRIYARLATYEDTGLDPEEINDMALDVATLKTIESMYDGLGNPDHLRDILQAEQDGRLLVLDEKIALSMCAGARAIENNKRLFGVTYSYDIFGVHGGPKEISYFEAAKKLREIAELFLTREEAEAALAQEGGEG